MFKVLVECREVIDSMMKLGEANAQLKQMEVALDAAQLGKQSAETEAALVKEKEEVSKSEVKRIESMVIIIFFILFTFFEHNFLPFCLFFNFFLFFLPSNFCFSNLDSQN